VEEKVEKKEEEERGVGGLKKQSRPNERQ